jgi:DNA polymerase epsilon subunit 1
LNVKEYWDYLVWYDAYNYGGKACQEVIEAEEQNIETIMNWQLATFLPPIYQTVFHDWVVEFTELMYMLKRPGALSVSQSTEASRPTQLPNRHLGSGKDNDDDVPATTTQALSQQIGKPLKRQILSLLARHRAELSNSLLAVDHVFPVLPGSHLDFSNTNPVLQLTKSLMHVYGLDQSLNLAIRGLRKELLALFEVREFSQKGRFENPSSSLEIEGWACTECTMLRDLELCRDEDLLPDNTVLANVDKPVGVKAWKCPHCHAEYSRLAIEEYLISLVQRMIVEWSTQDVKCGKCGGMRTESNEMMEHCACSGEWVGTVKREVMVEKLRILERASSPESGYGLRMLGSVVKEVLAGI